MPALKNGIGRINGPTPNNRFTDVNRAVYFGCIVLIVLSLLLYWLLYDIDSSIYGFEATLGL